ncbi:FAD dependent oxidoreductase [Pyrenophora teres f. maculata]|nr:FAD dependent oxidoreductase [Pyrenophora teres f. maculata]
MMFLISTNVQSFRSVLGDDASTVRFCQHNSELGPHINGFDTIDIWICEGDEVTEELMNQWLASNRGSPKTLLVNDANLMRDLENLSRGRVDEIQAIQKENQSESAWVLSTLRAAEKLYARQHVRHATHHKKANLDYNTNETVLIVGAGIMSLIAAESLAIRGFRVRIVDAGPDPRTCRDWTRLGATHGGGNARMFSYTEADSYNETVSDVYRDMRHLFRKTTLKGGWSVKPPSSYSAAEISWINTFEQVPIWLAQTMKKDIYHVNQEAGKLWAEYMDRAPELFEGVSLHNDVLRLYAEDVALTAAHGLNRELGVVVDEFSQSEFLRRYPGFSAAARSDELAGGFTVQGFTLGIHLFVERLIGRIIELHGEFSWNCCVQQIRRNASGEVTVLESQLGDLRADHFVISTGVTRNGLLDGTASENLVHGVLGVWLQIPNLDSALKNSIKIHRRGSLVEDINVTVSRDAKTNEEILILGGGYGYVGLTFPLPESPEMEELFNELEEVAHTYFPAGYQCAKQRGTLWPNGERKFCIRPFTPTGLGIFEDIPTASGGHLIITGGNNTGGFAQAPAIARAICRAVVGEYDPIHVLFNPHRSKLVDYKV